MQSPSKNVTKMWQTGCVKMIISRSRNRRRKRRRRERKLRRAAIRKKKRGKVQKGRKRKKPKRRRSPECLALSLKYPPRPETPLK